MRTLRLEPNDLQISISAEASSKQMSEEEEEADNFKHQSDDMDLFQACPLGSGFELDCWKNKSSDVTKQTEAIRSQGNSSFDEDPDGFDWNANDDSSVYSVEERDSSSISDDSEDDDDGGDDGDAENHDNDNILTANVQPGNSFCCRPSDVANTEEIPIIISKSVQILEPFFQAAVDHISGRHVHFGATVVTAEYTYEKPSADDFFRLYYSAHELQRLQDQYKIDICSTKSSSGPDGEETGVLGGHVGDSEDEIKQVDYCPDYPAW